MARLVPALLLCAASLAAATPTTDPDTPPSSQLAAAGIEINRFLAQCVDLAWLGIGLQCRGLSCAGEEGAGLSLEQLQRAACGRAEDCAPEHTGMTCVRGRCDCPPYSALNLTSCACQQSALCPAPGTAAAEDAAPPARCPEHNGRRCENTYCSCFSSPDFATLLVDPTSLFCVLPASPEELSLLAAGANSLGLAVLGALIGFLAVVLIAITIVATYKNCICERGDYKCDTPDGADLPETHIAAWDHPSMDYVSKDDENIIFTLCQASDSVRMSNASTIYVQDEDTTTYIKQAPGTGPDHENMAYVEEEEPRND